MRLRKIKLNGFKSFADSISIEFENEMTGIVGPNGCGKSNVVDAVRWVMGGTSRHVRATTLEDVIFSGTSTRKPLGQASAELLFDDVGGVAGGKFAQYTELALKRVVTRESESKYYINGTRCRRRDVADIFLGTGLGANSYAVVEQGMIARVVESKPEEMRAYVEEAAGVSQYKERRRDTENRIRRTRDNLDRVMDICEEVAKQLAKLKRQVKTAEKFKQLRQDKERLESELLLLKYRQREGERAARAKEAEDRRLDFEKAQAVLRKAEADAEQNRVAADEHNDELNRMKEEHYRLGAKISGEEQDIENREKGIGRLREERGEIAAMTERNAGDIEKQRELLADKERHGGELATRVERLNAEVERLREERSAARQALHETASEHQGEIERIGGEVAVLRDKVHELVEELNAARGRHSDIKGRHASLEALQEAELRGDKGAFTQWLEAAGLERKSRLGEQIRVEDGWERAVETVLGTFISGVEVASLEEHAARLGDFDKGLLVLFEPGGNSGESGTLADKVSGSDSLGGLLGRVRVADSLEQALQQRSSLAPHMSLITRDGAWVGPNWIKLHMPERDGEGVLLRERHMETLRRRLETESAVGDALKGDIENKRGELASKEAQRDQLQTRLAATLTEAATLEGDGEHSGEPALEEARNRLSMARENLHRVEVEREATRVEKNAAREQIERLQSLREELEQRSQSLNETLNEMARPMEESRRGLDALRAQHAEQQQQLDQHGRKFADMQAQSKTIEQLRVASGGEVETRRETYDQVRADLQVIAARCKDALDEFNKLEVEQARVEEGMEADASVETQEEKLERVQAGITRLGAINLVALEEFDELNERKEYLDSQHDDLTRALETLEGEMHRLDRETRELFKNTFDQINTNLQKTFPRLFGSGEAQLELTERDLLTTGVSVMVRPPGKRRVAISLLSGGEKALAAAAVVFSIFELNPAPFCLLDEVDAPLDEYNVERFCELLKSMSEQVQFVVITHNKLSMEYMGGLIGVTMQEAGVSRLVAVDIEEAAKMATA